MAWDEPFMINATGTASTSTKGSWALSSEYAVEAATTRAINRALNMLFHEAFAMGDGFGMGDTEQVHNTIEALIQELDAATTKQELIEIVKKINSHTSEMSYSQKRLAKILIDKKKNVIK